MKYNKDSMTWASKEICVKVDKFGENGIMAGTIYKKDGSFLSPLYSGYDITHEMVMKYVRN